MPYCIFNLSLLQGKVYADELQECVCPRAGVGMLAVCPQDFLDLEFLKTLDSGDVELRNPETSGPGTQQLWCPVLLGAFPFWKISIFLLLVNNIFCL